MSHLIHFGRVALSFVAFSVERRERRGLFGMDNLHHLPWNGHSFARDGF